MTNEYQKPQDQKPQEPSTASTVGTFIADTADDLLDVVMDSGVTITNIGRSVITGAAELTGAALDSTGSVLSGVGDIAGAVVEGVGELFGALFD